MNVKLTRKRQAPQPTQLSPSTIQIENNENIYSESQHRNDAIEAMKNSFDHHYHVSKSYLVWIRLSSFWASNKKRIQNKKHFRIHFKIEFSLQNIFRTENKSENAQEK